MSPTGQQGRRHTWHLIRSNLIAVRLIKRCPNKIHRITIRQPMRNSPTCLTPSSRPRAKSKSMSSLRSRRRPELGLTNPGSLSRWTGDFGPSRQQEPAERANVKH